MKNQDGHIVGCTAIDMESGEVVYFRPGPVLATGGGRIYQSTNVHISTGDGVGMALRAGVGDRTWSSGSSTRPASPGQGYW